MCNYDIYAIYDNPKPYTARFEQSEKLCNHTEASQATKSIIIIQNAYHNHVILSRTHEDIERMIALLVLTQSLSYL